MPIVAGGVPMVAKSSEPDCMAVRMSVPDWNSSQRMSTFGKAFLNAPVSFTSSSPLGDSQ